MQSVLIGDRLEQWGEGAPDWLPAERCRRRTEEFVRRMTEKRRRLSMPIIVALLGGTGTGKSTLVNAILGEQTVPSGNVRPTTNKPIMICRSDLEPEQWGIDTEIIEVQFSDSPALDRLVLLDCPDPDTTEDATVKETNLARLRQAMPLCDVLLVTGTQQKYRDHDILDELALAAPGARLVFVQTRAEKDVDIRQDWEKVLQNHYETGKIYFIDSVAALKNIQEAKELPGDFAELYELLTRELSEETAIRIREANYVDRAELLVTQCQEDLRQSWECIDKLKNEIEAERTKLGEKLAEKMQQELKHDRKLWETQLIQEVASRWWLSPFSIVLRVYQMLADVTAFFASFRSRSLMQLAMGRVSDVVVADSSPGSLEKINGLICWDMIELQKSALSLPGYLNQAGLPEGLCSKKKLTEEANEAGRVFLAGLSNKVRDVCGHLARRPVTMIVRGIFELILGIFLLIAMYLSAKNFFYDSWVHQTPILGINYYLILCVWFTVLGGVMLGVFLLVIGWGLDREIRRCVAELIHEHVLDSLFSDVGKTVQQLEHFRKELDIMTDQIAELHRIAASLDTRLGRRKSVINEGKR